MRPGEKANLARVAGLYQDKILIVSNYDTCQGIQEGYARVAKLGLAGDKSSYLVKGPRHTTSRGFPLKHTKSRLPSKQKGRTSHARDARCLRIRSITLAYVYKVCFSVAKQIRGNPPGWPWGENPADGLPSSSSPLKAATVATAVALSYSTHTHASKDSGYRSPSEAERLTPRAIAHRDSGRSCRTRCTGCRTALVGCRRFGARFDRSTHCARSLHRENSIEELSKSLGGGEEKEGRGWNAMVVDSRWYWRWWSVRAIM